ncbi:hypothetical protein HAX54_041793 [Datura stramonium]|uniref:50S ribosomal protein L32, chloroplastic n=1 Tax=Datura stramonium TaxID=4076 RepID=A0ABS8W1F2_DATST|nr:hypothetical protein [Datura stramonium]
MNLLSLNSKFNLLLPQSLHRVKLQQLKMASTVAKLRSSPSCIYGVRRFSHAISIPPPLDSTVSDPTASSPSFVLPEHDNNYNNIGFLLPNSPFFGGSMDLMAVPKKKVSPHKRGIRNGPKALKPVPVIMRCKVCGRVKLPHFFCCSGIKPGDENSSNS